MRAPSSQSDPHTPILAAPVAASMPPGSAMLLFSWGNLETET